MHTARAGLAVDRRRVHRESSGAEGCWTDSSMSRQGSAASVGSRKSTARYKSVGAGGVDESLFGGGKGPAQTGGMSKAKLEKLVNEKPTHVETDSIVITGN